MRKTLGTALLFAIFCATSALGQGVLTITDVDVQGDALWTADNTYLMDGYVYVEDGETLTIEAGTVIKGKADPTTGDQESALIVARGGKIFAEGTPTEPIIFTAEDDDVTIPDDLTLDDRGSWGGVIILGKATINVGGGENTIEGLPPEEPRNLYGGDDDDDNSGIFRYVSIRYGGAIFGQDNEINGLSLGAVGRGTQIDHVEVFANSDDGFEFFGGTVNTKYLISAFCGDDMFDYDEGWRGNNQFWFGIHSDDNAGSGGEHDGGTDPETGMPYATPVVYNATFIGAGATSLLSANDFALTIDDNAGGSYYNSIFTDFAGAGVTIEDLASGEDSRARLEAGQLVLSNNIWFGFGDVNSTGLDAYSDVFVEQYVADAFADDNFLGVDPMLRGVNRETDGVLDPRPAEGSPALTNGASTPPRDGFYQYTSYIGAFGYEDWAAGWSFISEAGYLSGAGVERPAPGQMITITDADVQGDALWTADNTYLMDGYVYVEDGETLTIEAGTVIKGKADPTTGDQESALIVARGGKIFAEGTPTEPIIFTAEDDDVTIPDDLTLDDRGSWGGVIILGKATINVGGGENTIEGLPPEEPRNLYGGDDDNDNSGIFRYVSIRYGGAIFGQDNEINGLSMGAVGRGTQIDHVEVFANRDDGYEWFGGTVDTKYLVAAFCGDDMFDYDEGWRGNNQFWFGIQADDDAGSGGEHDGGTGPETGMPYATPVVYNATYIGAGAASLLSANDFALTIDDNAGGSYYNSIFTDFAGAGVTIEDLASGEDSRSRLEAGDLVLSNNIWFGFGDVNGTGLDAYSDVFAEQYVADAFADDNFIGVDPMLRGVSRKTDGVLDPRPAEGSPALTSGVWVPSPDGTFRYASFIGAFDEWNWVGGWTFLAQGGYISTAIEPVDGQVPRSFRLHQNYPNPFNPSTTIEFDLDRSEFVRLSIYDVSGREIAVLVDGQQPAGTYQVSFDASSLASGMYLYRLHAGAYTNSKAMLLIK